MALSNTAFDQKLSMTINAWLSNNFTDIVLGNNAVFKKLQMNGNVKTNGFGTSLVEPFMFPSGTGPAAVGVADPYAVDVTQQETTGFTSASYIMAEYNMQISAAKYDLKAQGSDTKKIDYMEAITRKAMADFTTKLNADSWANPETAGSAGSRSRLASLRTFFNAGGATTTSVGSPPALAEQVGNRALVNGTGASAVTLVGGVERNATNAAYWCTPVINSADTLTVQVLSKIYGRTVRGTDHADLCIVHRDSMDKLQSLFSVGGGNGGQFFTSSKLADAGFDAIKFRGMDIVMDDSVPTAGFLNGTATAYAYQIFAINTNYLKLITTSMKPEMIPHDDKRPIKAWSAEWLGQYVSGHLGRVHCVHGNVTN